MRPLAKAVLAAILSLAPILSVADAQEAAEPAPPALAPPVASAPVPNPTPAPKRAPRAPAARPPAPPVVAAETAAAPAPTLPSGARLAPGQAIAPAELEAFVDGVVKSAMARDHVAGVTVSIVQNGQVVMKKGYGFADLAASRRVDPDRTLFRIGSISKTFTWIALMQEVEAGRIRLNSPVNLYLPQRLQVRDQGFEQEVLVRHLMSHAAGFEDRALGQLFERQADRERPLAMYLQQERPRRVVAPGVRSSYSNYGVGLAGAAISNVAQRPFERLVEERITGPLGLTRTTFREPRPAMQGLVEPMAPALARDLSEPYRWTPTGFRKRDFEYIGHIAPAGSVSSTAGDMARYMLLILNGGALDGVVVYSPTTAQAFRTPLRRAPAGINGWAHGFVQYALPGGYTGLGHNGATLSFMSNMVTIPQLGLGVFVSANTDTGAALTEALPGRIVRQFYAPPEPVPLAGSPALRRRADAFEGYYLVSRRAYGGLEGFVSRIIGGVQVSVTPDGRLVVAAGQSPGGPALYAPDGDPAQGRFVAASGVDRIQFTFDDGRASSFVTGTNAARIERAGPLARPGLLALLAALTVLAALATLGGILRRMRREHRESLVQARASLVQNTQAVLWLAAIALFGIWAAGTSDVANVLYNFPTPTLIIASACALLAAVLTAVSVVLTPIVWRGGRRVDSWTPYRKLAFTVTTLIYLAFSVVLLDWGALTPWA